MIGQLPKFLEISGKSYPINSDFRVMLNIFNAFSDPELTDREKCYICINNLFANPETIPKESMSEAIEKAYWFVGGGGTVDEDDIHNEKIFDWEQDEKIIFPAINKVAGFEIRSAPYIHWWTFLGYFGEIGEGLFSYVMHIRSKKSKGKKLDKSENEFLREHEKLVKIKKKYTKEEQQERDAVNALLD